MKTKTPRIIRVKDPRLRRLRKNLRLVLRAAVEKKLIGLREEYKELELNSNLSLLEKNSKRDTNLSERTFLSFLRSKHPLGCTFCGVRAVEEDLLYNPADHRWYCEWHYKYQQDYYKENPHPWLPSWDKMYPPLPSEDNS
jgi:hypothetical protein